MAERRTIEGFIERAVDDATERAVAGNRVWGFEVVDVWTDYGAEERAGEAVE
jgi:hypothetical protein